MNDILIIIASIITVLIGLVFGHQMVQKTGGSDEKLNNLQDKSKQMKKKPAVYTDEQLKDRFGGKYELSGLYKTSPDWLKQFFLYIYSNYPGGDKNADINATFELAKTGDDYAVLKFIRDKIFAHIGVEQILEQERSVYKKITKNKLNKLADMLRSVGIVVNKNANQRLKTSLDIGTERMDFLDDLQARFKIESAMGINIDAGFSHYEEDFAANTKDPRFKLYDGLHIPAADSSFDLITIFSVIHHIPPENLPEFTREVYRVCRRYLFIKDVDLSEPAYSTLFRFQHYLYEGVIVPSDSSYMNDRLTSKHLVGLLTKAGFKITKVFKQNNFINGFYILLSKPQ